MRNFAAVAAVGVAMLIAPCAFAQNMPQPGAPVATQAAQPITPAQRARLAEKLAMVSNIVAQMSDTAKREGLAAGWRQSAVNTLLGLNNETLAQLSHVTSPSGLPTALATAKRVSPKALGSSTEDLVYTPIVPCRYIDTRNVGGKINGTRSFDFDLNSYGGTCPNDPYGLFGGTLGAVAANVAIVDPSNAPGFATIVPVGASPSVALVNWFEAGPVVQASNAAIITNDQGGTLAEIDIFTTGPVHVIVDIFGAFRANQATALECTTAQSQGTGTANVPNNTQFSITPHPSCPASYTFVSQGCEYSGGSPAGLALTQIGTGPGFTACIWRNQTGATLDADRFFADSVCCRVPGR
jgi:hypothetical protein